MNLFQNILTHLSSIAYLLLGVNLLLLVYAKHILQWAYRHSAKISDFKRKVMIFRALNLLILVVHGYYLFYRSKDSQALGIKIIAVLATIYLAYLCMQLMHALLLRHYGKPQTIDGKERQTPTHQTRLLDIFSSLFIAMIALIGIIHFLGFNSLLEAGGVLGFIGVFLALTSSIWAPDIFHGIIILNSDMLSEGDVIEFKDESASRIIGIVYRTKIFHTVILDQLNNHRIMIRNSRLRDFTIHNLSKFASAKGLREKITFKIGYDCNIAQVEKMFQEAYIKAGQDSDLAVENQYKMVLAIDDTGDHAVEWALYFYTKEARDVIATRQKMIRLVYSASIAHNISLSTPFTHVQQAYTDVGKDTDGKGVCKVEGL